MANLTLSHIQKTIAGDVRFDAEIDLDELGKAIVWLSDGYTWCAADDNRSVEGFIISALNYGDEPRDTVAYWNERVACIESIA
jgi:hypothetical protein